MGSRPGRFLAAALCAAAWLAFAPNALAESAVDASTLHFKGARSEGGMLLPSSRVLEEGAWDLSLTYGHEGKVLRTRVPTDSIRGGVRSREVGWLESRDLMLLHLAMSPWERLEIGAGFPLLLGQETSSDLSLEPPRSGSTAFGDLRLGARYALTSPGAGGWAASLHGGLFVPLGGSEFAMGETKARADVAGSFGFEGEGGWSAHALVGHRMGQQRMVGDQIAGDTAYGGILLQYSHAISDQRLLWSLEAVTTSVLAASEPREDPRRTSLEILGGARVFVDSLYVDLGAGVGAVDAGITPGWRVLASIGALGLWERAAPQAPPPPAWDRPALPPLQEPAAPEAPPPPPEEPVQPRHPAEDSLRAPAVEERAIFFDVGKAELDEVARSLLREVALHLLSTDRSVRITGYADDQGTKERNELLSRRRAETVRDALIEAGVREDRLSVAGAGDASPLGRPTGFGRSINRRVTFTFSD